MKKNVVAFVIVATGVILFAGVTGCHGPTGGDAAVKNTVSPADSAQAAALAKRKAFKALAFDNKKDPACGMPLTAGVEDTVHYKGKLYGFCSTECKDEFLKNPEGHLAENK
jgi:YHS domain-containing protein